MSPTRSSSPVCWPTLVVIVSCFSYTGQPVQAPPGFCETSPSQDYWTQAATDIHNTGSSTSSGQSVLQSTGLVHPAQAAVNMGGYPNQVQVVPQPPTLAPGQPTMIYV